MSTTSLSLFRFDGAVNRLWIIAQMGAARLALRGDADLRFWKLCGSGTGEGFTPRPNWGVWAILAVWTDAATAAAHVATHPVWNRWRARATEAATIFLSPLSARGAWAGVNPFTPPEASPDTRAETPPDATACPFSGPAPSGPLAALTRATVKPANALKFWGRVPDISAVIGTDPNVRFKIGIGEVPLLHQVTFSIWPDAATMAAFARGNGPHGQAIRAVRDGHWFAEELYARFTVLDATGIWDGRPLRDRLFPHPATAAA